MTWCDSDDEIWRGRRGRCRGSIPLVTRARGGAGGRRHGLQSTAAAAAADVQRDAVERKKEAAAAAGRKRGGGLGFGEAEGVLVVLGGRWRGAPGVRWPRHAFGELAVTKDGGGSRCQRERRGGRPCWLGS